MLYSFRESKNANYPDFKSQQAINALEMFNKISDFSVSGTVNKIIIHVYLI